MYAVSSSNKHAIRKLHADNNLQRGVASSVPTSHAYGSSAMESPTAGRFGGAKRAANARGAGASAKDRSSAQGLEDIPVGPGRTGAGVDFEKLIEQKLQEQGEASSSAATPFQLHQCGSCGRQFAAAAIKRHRAVCAKVFASKRPPLDMAQQRLEGMKGGAGDMGEGARYGRTGKAKEARGRGAAGRAGALGGKGAMPAPLGEERPAVAGGVSRAGNWKQQSQQLRAAMNINKCASTSLPPLSCSSCALSKVWFQRMEVVFVEKRSVPELWGQW